MTIDTIDALAQLIVVSVHALAWMVGFFAGSLR